MATMPRPVAEIRPAGAVKPLPGIGEPLAGRMLHYDALAGLFNDPEVWRDPSCRGRGRR